jgi:hypothetical protein
MAALSQEHCNNSRSFSQNNGRWSQNTAISNTDAITTAEATTRADAITAEALARTTADGVQNTAISNNTDALSRNFS